MYVQHLGYSDDENNVDLVNLITVVLLKLGEKVQTAVFPLNAQKSNFTLLRNGVTMQALVKP